MCSKKTSGIALLVTGFILVALGVIIGLMLPNKAQTTVEDNVCVDSKDSPGYDRWVSLCQSVYKKKQIKKQTKKIIKIITSQNLVWV